jgi:hypothetical protein
LFPTIDQSGAGWPYQTLIGVDNISKHHLTWSLFSPEQRQILSWGRIAIEPFTPLNLGTRVRQPADQFGTNVIYSVDGIGSAPYNDGFNIWLAFTVYIGVGQQLGIRWYHLYIDPVTRHPGLVSGGLLSDRRLRRHLA